MRFFESVQQWTVQAYFEDARLPLAANGHLCGTRLTAKYPPHSTLKHRPSACELVGCPQATLSQGPSLLQTYSRSVANCYAGKKPHFPEIQASDILHGYQHSWHLLLFSRPNWLRSKPQKIDEREAIGLAETEVAVAPKVGTNIDRPVIGLYRPHITSGDCLIVTGYQDFLSSLAVLMRGQGAQRP